MTFVRICWQLVAESGLAESDRTGALSAGVGM
jgi:hypothetical protein